MCRAMRRILPEMIFKAALLFLIIGLFCREIWTTTTQICSLRTKTRQLDNDSGEKQRFANLFQP